jgi:phosphohistidine phosphatase
MPSKIEEIYVFRHGIAADHGTYSKDSDRPLTEEGIEKTGKVARAMKKMDLGLDLILSSPYVRARETAEIAAKELGLKKQLHLSDHLIVEGNPLDLIREIHKNYSDAKRIMIVGHEPYLSGFISALSAGANSSICNIKKAGLAKLTIHGELRYNRCAVLDWLLTPRQMIAMAD